MTILFLGDSQVDTLFFNGDFWELKLALEEKFPDESIQLLNHGVGATDVSLGLTRLTNPYEYSERQRSLPAVVETNPDIIIVGDFAYNHWSSSEADVEKYLSTHHEILTTLRTQTSADIWHLSAMAPNQELYVTAIPSLGWSEKKRLAEYQTTLQYLQAFDRFAQQTGQTYLNCFEKTLTHSDGAAKFISNVDFIHPSVYTRRLVAELIVEEVMKKM